MASFNLIGETSLALPTQAILSLLKISTGVITVGWLHAIVSSNPSLYRDVIV